jgi:CDP-paratose 2-epimerase
MCQEISGNTLIWSYTDKNRNGDHIWWISDLAKFRMHYPEWQPQYDVPGILREIHEANSERWVRSVHA